MSGVNNNKDSVKLTPQAAAKRKHMGEWLALGGAASEPHGAMFHDVLQRTATKAAIIAQKQSLVNSSTQLPGAGANTLEGAPGFLGKLLGGFQDRFPRAFAATEGVLRYGGVLAAFSSFGLSVFKLATTWKDQTTESKALNSAATGATGVASYEGVQFLRGAASASRLMGAWLGVAGSIYQGITAYKEFNDPTKTPGQRGMATTAGILSAAGAIACFVPGGQVVGFPLMLAGGVLGFLGDKIGKLGPVNGAFSWMGRTISKIF